MSVWCPWVCLANSTGRTGRPTHDHRTILNGILWILRTGAPWRDLPDRYGAWQTVYSRFRRWRRAGLWDDLLRIMQWEVVAAAAGAANST